MNYLCYVLASNTVYMKLKLDYVFWHVDDGLKVVFVKVNA